MNKTQQWAIDAAEEILVWTEPNLRIPLHAPFKPPERIAAIQRIILKRAPPAPSELLEAAKAVDYLWHGSGLLTSTHFGADKEVFAVMLSLHKAIGTEEARR